MRAGLRPAICFLMLATPFAAMAAAPIDACAGKLPASLVATLEAAHPDYRAPRESDNLAEDVASFRKRGGDGCLGVASADFDGDGVQDFVVALTPRKGDVGRAVVALADGGHWYVQPVLAHSDYSRSRLYVDTVPPATRLERHGGFDGPLHADERDSLVCPHAIAVAGAIEHSGIGHCLSGGVWQFVWFSE